MATYNLNKLDYLWIVYLGLVIGAENPKELAKGFDTQDLRGIPDSVRKNIQKILKGQGVDSVLVSLGVEFEGEPAEAIAKQIKHVARQRRLSTQVPKARFMGPEQLDKLEEALGDGC